MPRFLQPRLVLCFLLLVGARGLVAAPAVFPGGDWERDTNGLSPETVQGVEAFVRTLDTTGLMVIRHGQVVYEYGDVQRLSYLASARKSVLSMLYGPYVASGQIRLEATLKELGMSDVGGLLPIEERARVVDLITARSGVYHPASNPGDLTYLAPRRGSREPGSRWLYNNWDFNAAGAAFERMTGKNIYDAFRDDLAVPLGMQDFDRRRQQKSGNQTRSQYPAYHFMLSTRDMARLGLLMLRQGKWGDRQLIPADWVSRSTAIRTPRTEMRPKALRLAGPMGYGYMWWRWDEPYATGPYEGAYTAAGAYGQFITVLPALDMVVAHKTRPPGHVDLRDYLPLLDMLTGKRPASAAGMFFWNHAPRLSHAFRRLTFGAQLLLGLVEIYPVIAGILAVLAGAVLVLLGRKWGLRKLSKRAVIAVSVIGVLIFVGAWLRTPAKAPAPPKAPIAIKLDPGIYDRYAGRYLMAPQAKLPTSITIRREGDALMCQVGGEFAEEIFPLSETAFFNTMESALVTFVKDDKNQVNGLILAADGKERLAKKVEGQ
jgi:CubicO group peptidase (beta-lactamase class C family)